MSRLLTISEEAHVREANVTPELKSSAHEGSDILMSRLLTILKVANV